MASKKHWNQKQTNTLLLKSDVGTSKPSAYDLPNAEFRYGKSLPTDIEGAKESIIKFIYNSHNNMDESCEVTGLKTR